VLPHDDTSHADLLLYRKLTGWLHYVQLKAIEQRAITTQYFFPYDVALTIIVS